MSSLNCTSSVRECCGPTSPPSTKPSTNTSGELLFGSNRLSIALVKQRLAPPLSVTRRSSGSRAAKHCCRQSIWFASRHRLRRSKLYVVVVDLKNARLAQGSRLFARTGLSGLLFSTISCCCVANASGSECRGPAALNSVPVGHVQKVLLRAKVVEGLSSIGPPNDPPNSFCMLESECPKASLDVSQGGRPM